MTEFGTLLGIAAIILALFFGCHLISQDNLAEEKLKTECVCKENK